ncbi:universal stress protein [Mycolicibacterium litorale]|nr:universal stress protein [Mycolicibacterium litorale]
MPVKVVVGYDGSPQANAAIEAAAVLFPDAHGIIAHMWVPPFASDRIRRRLRVKARNIEELLALIEDEGCREAQRIAATGVALARSAGWDAEPLVQQTFSAEGVAVARAANEMQADVVLVGSRGLGGTQALLGSVSDMVAHYSSRPTVVVPSPMLSNEYAAMTDGPVVVGWDGSPGAETAATAAARLFPQRDLLLVSVDDGTACTAPAPDQIAGRGVRHLNVDPSLAFRNRGIAEALAAAADDNGAAAVTVGSRGQSAVREILLGSVAMSTLHHSHRPVMVVSPEWKCPSDA